MCVVIEYPVYNHRLKRFILLVDEPPRPYNLQGDGRLVFYVYPKQQNGEIMHHFFRGCFVNYYIL